MITLVFARAENGVIGQDGKLPWHLPADLQHFKALTVGRPMIMGRKTFDSFPAPLPGRRHIVLTRDRDWCADGAEVVHSVAESVEIAGGDVAVIGGADILRQFDARADRAEWTAIWRSYPGDAVYDFDQRGWREVGHTFHPAVGDKPAFTFFTLEKRR